MRHRLLRGFVLLTAFAAILVQAQPVPNRYIVELSTEPVAGYVAQPSVKSNLRSAAANSHRARILSEQATLRTRLAATPSVRVLDSVNTVANALFVEAPDRAALESMPGVLRVRPVHEVHLHLDRAIAIHKVVEAWSRIGGTDNAGAGIKIAIIDTGIDSSHPGFANSGLKAPSGYPRTNADTDLSFTNGKVIVARSYVNLLPRFDSDRSARDRVGHGTALGMIAAGGRVTAPLANLQGIAPQAWLGNYKVFGTPGVNDSSSDDAIMKAIDDAVNDGMDIINLSLGLNVAPRLEEDPYFDVIERATRAGVIVVVSAGNDGPDMNTMSSPGTVPSAITLGAVGNDRTFGTSVAISGRDPVGSYPGQAAAPASAVNGTLFDVASLESSGQACSTFPASSLSGAIALIRRGNCTFEAKILNAQRAGALGAIIFANEDSPDAIYMATGTATLPAMMVSAADGISLRAALAAGPVNASMRFALGPVSVSGGRISSFSSAGPNVNLGIKPDLVAVGENFYTATQSFDRNGEMYSSNGYVLIDGTSFSSPFVAGTAALLKAARPGLTVDQYRSLLINTAQPLSGPAAPIQKTGAGLVNANAALGASAVLNPVSLSFGAGAPEGTFRSSFALSNLTNTGESWSITVDSRTCPSAPSVSQSDILLDGGATRIVEITWSPTGLPKGACEGTFNLTGNTSGTILRLPWWYGVTDAPAIILELDGAVSDRRSATVTDAFLFKIIDAAGVPLGSLRPEAKVIAGGGEVVAVNNYDSDIPGAYSVDVRLGALPGVNTFEITVGSLKTQFSVTGR